MTDKDKEFRAEDGTLSAYYLSVLAREELEAILAAISAITNGGMNDRTDLFNSPMTTEEAKQQLRYKIGNMISSGKY